MVSTFTGKVKVTASVRANTYMLCGLFTGAFSFLYGENDKLFGKHNCVGILTPAEKVVGLKDKRSSRLFPRLGCVRYYNT